MEKESEDLGIRWGQKIQGPKCCVVKANLPSLLCRAKPSVLSGLVKVLTLSPCSADPSPVS